LYHFTREYSPERSRVPRPRLSHRKRNHLLRILPALSERLLNACNQNRIASPSRSRRSRRPPSLHSLDGQSLVRSVSASDSASPSTSIAPGSFQLLSHEIAILCVLLLRGPQLPANFAPRRNACILSTIHAVQSSLQHLMKARAARQSSSAPARHQGVPLRPSFVWRRRVVWSCRIFRGEPAAETSAAGISADGDRYRASGERSRGRFAMKFQTFIRRSLT